MKPLVLFLMICFFGSYSSMATEYNKNTSAKQRTDGSITGLVLDNETRQPLTGVNVIVEGTRRGTTTNRNGEFTISEIETGTYTLLFDFIGYARKEITNKIKTT